MSKAATPEEELRERILDAVEKVYSEEHNLGQAADEILTVFRTTLMDCKVERRITPGLITPENVDGENFNQGYNQGIDAAFTAIMEALGGEK